MELVFLVALVPKKPIELTSMNLFIFLIGPGVVGLAVR
jgi:hypothetical protein